jgi:hypothetical protein
MASSREMARALERRDAGMPLVGRDVLLRMTMIFIRDECRIVDGKKIKS